MEALALVLFLVGVLGHLSDGAPLDDNNVPQLPPVVEYHDVKMYLDNEDVFVIDVRNSTEREQAGVIPGAKHIPIWRLADSLQASEEEFDSINEFEKPEFGDPIILFCHGGVRAKAAAELAMSLGYTNVAYYRGSYRDWKANMLKETSGGAVNLPAEVTYEEVKDHLAEGSAMIVDVRNVTELLTAGNITGAENIPLWQLQEALTMDKDTFKSTYQFEKPELDDPVIFSCRTGRRSGLAVGIAKKLGYTNVANYRGSITEWNKKTEESDKKLKTEIKTEKVQLPEIVTYEEVKQHLAENTALVVDVRNKSELLTAGNITGALNIQLWLLEDALKLNEDVFKAAFKIEKPKLDDPIIFSCRTGRRSGLAVLIANELGYTNVANYRGSITEWNMRRLSKREAGGDFDLQKEIAKFRGQKDSEVRGQ